MEGAYYLCFFLLETSIGVPIKKKKKKNCLDVLYSIANPMFVFGCLLAPSLIAFTSTDAWFVAIPDNITTNYCIAINISFLLSS